MPSTAVARAWPQACAAGGRRAVATGASARPVVASALLLPPQELAGARLLYVTAGAPAHDYPGHAECAERVPAILRALEAGGLTEGARPGEVGAEVRLVEARAARS